MRRLTIVLAALFVAAGLTTAAPAEAREPATYAYRACWDFQGYANGVMCFKVYVRKQTDGSGLVNTNRHVYAFTRTDSGPSSNCGTAFDNPATSKSNVGVYNAAALTPKWQASGPQLSIGNSCDVQWAGDVGVGGDFITMRWVVNPNKQVRPDGDDKVLTIMVNENGSWVCQVPESNASDYCTKTGPF